MQREVKQVVANTLLLLGLLVIVIMVTLYLPALSPILYLVLLVPLAVVVGGRLVIVILDLLSDLGTATLAFSTYQVVPKLAFYYSITAGIVALMIQNSIILSSLFVQMNIFYVGAIALRLAFLPRVVSFASSVE